MTALYDHLLTTVFPGVLQHDPDVLRAIEAFDGDLRIDGDRLLFTVPALFAFVCQSYATQSGQHVETSRETYLRFRKALYGNPTNGTLARHGARVEVETTDPDHDRSVYRLVRTGRTDRL